MTAAGACWLAARRDGDFAAAWAVNDAVLAASTGLADDPSLPYHRRHVWDGRRYRGRHVLVRCYHGLGDTLQFVRYLPALRCQAASVALEAQPELLALLACLPGVDRLIPFRTEAPTPPSECDIEAMELAHALRLPPGAAPPPYLTVDPLSRRERVGVSVGLCAEAGNWDRDRSVPLPLLAAALPPGVRPIRLQRDAGNGVDWANPDDALATITET
ncbi:MAG: hypothetical protein M3Y41_15915, partial [Pseudomonadota bacterium]|nr:hypothetical protein [Pseudomonadota bacterium]